MKKVLIATALSLLWGEILATSPGLADDPWRAGYADCIARHDPGCVVDTTAPFFIHEKPLTISILKGVNDQVNQHMIYKTDPDNYPGKVEYWISGRLYGDCEDFQLTKRAELIALGFSPNALRMAAVEVWGGPLIVHALLLVYSDAHPRDPYVLDNVRDGGLILRRLSDPFERRYTFLYVFDGQGGWETFAEAMERIPSASTSTATGNLASK